MEDQHTHCSNSGSCISRQLISLPVSVREKPFRQLGHVHVGFWISKRSLFEITRQTRLALCRNLQSPFRFAPIAVRLATTPCVPSILPGCLAFPSRYSARWSNKHFGRNAERCMQTTNHADG